MTLPAAGAPVHALFLVDDDRVATVAGGRRLRVFDRSGAVLMEHDAIAAAAAGSSIVALAPDGTLSRIDSAGGATELVRVERGAELVLSRSGHFAVVDDDDAHDARLLDLERGVEIARVEADPSRACFDVLPGGDEVVFVAAPSYMDVRAIACASGAEVARHEHGPDGWDFCHVDFGLAAGGTRLVVFGCVWAWPYDARTYDASTWLHGGTRLPAPLLAIAPIACNTLLACDRADAAGLCTSACVEVSAQLGPDALEPVRRDDPALAAQLDRAIAEGTHALIVRRIDPSRAAIVAAGAHPIAPVQELDVHYADGGRVVLFGERLIVADTDGVVDHGPLAPHAHARTCVTRDASLAIIAPD